MSQKRTGKRVTMAAIEDDFERAQILDKETNRPRNAHLQWQMSTPVSVSRASLMPAIADRYKTIISDLGEDVNRAGLVDTPKRAAQALLFFTKGYEDR